MKTSLRITKFMSVVTLSAVLLATGWKGAEPVQAAANATPSYEVKLLLDTAQVLNADGSLKSGIVNEFGVSEDAQRLSVEFFDTDSLQLNDEGWNVRFRKKEDKKNYELTYKKRYTITNGNIDAALTQANKEGFSASDDNYEAEVDWGYSKQTLSFSNDKKTNASKGLALPSLDQALKQLQDNLPGKLQNWKSSNWGKHTLANSRVRGPVQVNKYKGSFQGLDTDVEVWPIRSANGSGTDNIIEISFKTSDYNTAASNRTKLMNLLQSKGWLIPADSLKTNLVLERY
ncbi:hypothetical protein QYF52_24770 [Paenibacillus polymyxa]|uniref:hypothetical protein n=1 Tax=Paenibacillus polymyxa TaxID=1406 RepID=UPI0025B64AAA|nr:hypothetical protein [Paenibacillus polymyxa]MDN4081150.1 hypothetical protein [Paenibacillus polymyxa]MDN4106870.1 hypothetical protein [Paenibacillus polymyxa]MDN4116743.1 hypothetical protein [Paenibacillus polymyxa]